MLSRRPKSTSHPMNPTYFKTFRALQSNRKNCQMTSESRGRIWKDQNVLGHCLTQMTIMTFPTFQWNDVIAQDCERCNIILGQHPEAWGSFFVSKPTRWIGAFHAPKHIKCRIWKRLQEINGFAERIPSSTPTIPSIAEEKFSARMEEQGSDVSSTLLVSLLHISHLLYPESRSVSIFLFYSLWGHLWS